MKNQDPNHFFGKAQPVNWTITLSRASGRAGRPPLLTRIKRNFKKIWRIVQRAFLIDKLIDLGQSIWEKVQEISSFLFRSRESVQQKN